MVVRAGARRLRQLSGTASVRASSWAMVGQVAAIIAATANFVLLARLVGPADYGIITGAWALVLTLGPIATLGADRLIVRDVSASDALPRAALGAGLLTALSGGAVAVAALVASHSVVLPQVPLALLAALAVADIIATGVVACLAALFFASGDARAGGLSAAVVSTAKVAAVVVFALTDGDDPVRWAVIYACFALGSATLQTAWAVRRFGRPVLRDYHPLVRAREGLPYSVNAAATIAQNDSDKTLLVRSGYAEEAGLYSVAYRLSTMGYLPALAVLQAMFPRFFAVGGERGLSGSAALARRLVRPLAAYGLFAGVVLVVVAPLIPVVVGEEFRESTVLLMLLAPLPFFRILQAVSGDALTGAGQQTTRTACVLISAGVNVALNVAFIPRFGLAAALVSTFVAEVLFAALIHLAVRRGLAKEAKDFAEV